MGSPIGRGAGRRWWLATSALAGSAVLWVSMGTAPAWAHAGHRLAEAGSWWQRTGGPVASAWAVSLSVVTGGLLLGGALVGRQVRASRYRLALGLSILAQTATVLGAAWWTSGSRLDPALVLGLLWLGWALGPHRPWPSAVVGVGVVVAGVALEPPRGLELGVALLHVLVAAGWAGAVLHLALLTGPDPRLRERVAGFHRRAAVLTAGVLGTGAAEAAVHLRAWYQLTQSAYGHVLVGKLALVLGAAGLGWASHRGASRLRFRIRWLRAEAVALVSVVGATSLLLSLPLPPLVTAGNAAAGSATSVDDTVGVMTMPAPRHRQLVFVGFSDPTSGIQVAADGVGARPLTDLGGGRWVATLPLRTTPHEVEVSIAGRRTVSVGLGQLGASVTNGIAARSDATTLDTLIGRAAAAAVGVHLRPFRGPDALADAAAAGDLAVRLRRSGARRVGLLDGSDARSMAFGRSFRVASSAAGLALVGPGAPAEALVVASGPDKAVAALASATARRAYPLGVHLAPWLLDPSVLRQAVAGGPFVDLASDLAPTSALAGEYLRLEGDVAPAFAPSADGLFAFLEGVSGWSSPSVRFYAVSGSQFLPPLLDSGHEHGGGGWMAGGGQVVPLS